MEQRMSLSPWQAMTQLSCDEIASALAGFNLSVERNRDLVIPFADEAAVREYNEWRRAIALAVERGELHTASGWEAMPNLEQADDHEAKQNPVLIALNMEATFERDEVYRWLKSFEASDDEIPEALRIKPSYDAANRRQSNYDEQPSALATIGALIELLMDSKRPSYNQARLTDDLAEKFSDVRGFSASQMQKLFAAANKELENRRK
jgi:hypothetical protein